MDTPVTVVVIQSLSFTGTTWLNYVLGSHPDIFALGPADRPFALPRNQAAEACRVHGKDCPFWPGFYETWEEGKNFFVHLAERSGKRIIVTNNPLPTGAGTALQHPLIDMRPIRFVRDGRAVAESFARKHPDQAFFDVVRNWLAPSFLGFAFDRADPDTLCLRYEDVLADQMGMLEKVGRFVGVEYDASALRFWEHEHHPAAGNAGPINVLRIHQGAALPAVGQTRQFYQEQYDKTIADPNHQFESDGWKTRLSARERFIFDLECGAKNAELGYERDRFTTDEFRRFSSERDEALEPVEPEAVSPAPEPAPPEVRPAPVVPVAVAPRSEATAAAAPRSGGSVVAVVLAATVLGVVSLLAAYGVL